jgi:hypothetical protein
VQHQRTGVPLADNDAASQRTCHALEIFQQGCDRFARHDLLFPYWHVISSLALAGARRIGRLVKLKGGVNGGVGCDLRLLEAGLHARR